MIFPDGGGFHHQTGDVQLQNGGQILVGDVLNKGVGRQLGNTPKIKFVAHTDDGAGVLVRPALGDFVAFPQLFNEQRRGDVRVQRPVNHEALEVVLPGGGKIVQSILKGAGLAHGEMVVIAEIQLPAFLHKGVQRLVGLAVGLDNVVVEHQIIAGPVAHQDVAVAVKDITTGGTDGGNGGVFCDVVGVAVCLDDLKVKKLHGEQRQNRTEQNQKQDSAKSAYSFHVVPPIRPILLMSGYSKIMTPKL